MSPRAVPSGRTTCQSALEPGSSVPFSSGPAKVPLGQWHDPPAALSEVAEVEWFAHRGFEAVDLACQGWSREACRSSRGRRRIVWVCRERYDRDPQPVGERQGAE